MTEIETAVDFCDICDAKDVPVALIPNVVRDGLLRPLQACRDCLEMAAQAIKDELVEGEVGR